MCHRAKLSATNANHRARQRERSRPFAVTGLWVWLVLGGVASSQVTAQSTRANAEPAAIPQPSQSSSQLSNGTATAPAVIELPRRSQPATKVDQQVARLDPAVDGWESEVFHDAVQPTLKTLAKFVGHPDEGALGELKALTTDDFTCQILRPAELKWVFSDGALTVWRADAAAAKPERTAADHRGVEGLATALRTLSDALGQTPDKRAALKQFHVEKTATGLATLVLYEASSRSATEGLQQNATWRCEWVVSPADPKPRLRRIALEQYEELKLGAQSGQLLVDCTEAALSANACYRQDILPGLNHWLSRLTRLEGMSKFGHHGIAVGDVNNDGLEDLYMCNVGGLPNHLFVQQPDGTALDRAAEAGVDFLEYCPAALLVDLDSDGWQDLVVAGQPRILFAQNDRAGHFVLRWSLSTVADPVGLSAADFDNDGDLDIYVCGYRADSNIQSLASPVPYHDANNGGRNALFRNDGGFQFVDATDAAGLNVNNTRYSFAAAWEDFDNDGDLDLYVANDFGRNNLYRNDTGHFTDIAAQAGVEDIGSGMSVSWADYNRDGRMDVYVGNMFSSAGNRVAYQRKFAQSQSSQTVKHLQRMARGNTLFESAADGTFVDVSEDANVTMGRWAWASKFADLNNDGWPDLVVANGYLTGEDPSDL
ncbi:MAG: VCBS repeat-containing protein [Verrucomicrobia bacterium]|nr:VCBS repeat-containing protein [Verrucomicrobiota bacterium]